jgi:Zn-finger nucleic acid-binding protein
MFPWFSTSLKASTFDRGAKRVIRCPQCDIAMKAVAVPADPGRLIELDQCGQCGGVWCDKWELFPVDPEEAERLDPVDQELLIRPTAGATKVLYCPRCTGALHQFKEPLLPADIHLLRCMHCDGIWLNRGELRRYKEFQKKTQLEKLGAEEIVHKIPALYQDPKSWVVTGTQGMLAYPQGYADEKETVTETLSSGARLALQALVRLILGI